jgi:radical SAM superfamily enzyme YgiQ (UPF0313 family)
LEKNWVPFERPEIIRPPSEAGSYFLPLTNGCSNNSCTFCNYFDKKLQIRDYAEIKKEIDALELFLKHQVSVSHIPHIVYAIANEWDGKRIFLQDADALVYPYPQLLEILQYLNKHFPHIERIASYGTPQDILRLDIENLKALKKSKLRIIYMGVESGDDLIIRNVNKGVNSQQIIEAGRRVKAAGILLSVTVILGLGGLKLSPQHALATANILTELDPDYAGALTLTLIPGTPLYEQYCNGTFSLISPMQSVQELKAIVENARFTHCFFSSMHASNYFSIRGRLPEEKANILSELNYVLTQENEHLLRPEFLRGL